MRQGTALIVEPECLCRVPLRLAAKECRVLSLRIAVRCCYGGDVGEDIRDILVLRAYRHDIVQGRLDGRTVLGLGGPEVHAELVA